MNSVIAVHHWRHEAAADQQTQQPAQGRPAHHDRRALEGLEVLWGWVRARTCKALKPTVTILVPLKISWPAFFLSCFSVHNWTQDAVLRWLKEFVELPQYEKNFKEFKVNGNTLPRWLCRHDEAADWGFCKQRDSCSQRSDWNARVLLTFCVQDCS